MNRSTRLSHYCFVGLLLLVKLAALATPLLTILFAYFALIKMHWFRRRWIAVVWLVLLVGLLLCGFSMFVRTALKVLPDVIAQSVPKIAESARAYGIDLPISDAESTRAFLGDTVRDELGELAKVVGGATREFVLLIIGLVIAASLYLSRTLEDSGEKTPLAKHLYDALSDQMQVRFQHFFASFRTVIGAQLVISTINTCLTAVFILSADSFFAQGFRYPFPIVIIGTTFLCGLLPIIGNLISNTLTFGIAFTISTNLAVAALIFLIVLHKLEYFLNSKIIGGRIKTPMWLTLIGLIAGESIMGIPGMILAPVIIHYTKTELSLLPPESGEPAEAARTTAK